MTAEMQVGGEGTVEVRAEKPWDGRSTPPSFALTRYEVRRYVVEHLKLKQTQDIVKSCNNEKDPKVRSVMECWINACIEWFNSQPASNLIRSDGALIQQYMSISDITNHTLLLDYFDSLSLKMEECQRDEPALLHAMTHLLQKINPTVFGGNATRLHHLVEVRLQRLAINDDKITSSTYYSSYRPILYTIHETVLLLPRVNDQINIEHYSQLADTIRTLMQKYEQRPKEERYYPYYYQLERINQTVQCLSKSALYARNERLKRYTYRLMGFRYSFQVLRSLILEFSLDIEAAMQAVASFQTVLKHELKGSYPQASILNALNEAVMTILDLDETKEARSNAADLFFGVLKQLDTMKRGRRKNNQNTLRHSRYCCIHQLTALSLGAPDSVIRVNSVDRLVQLSEAWFTEKPGDTEVSYEVLESLSTLAVDGDQDVQKAAECCLMYLASESLECKTKWRFLRGRCTTASVLKAWLGDGVSANDGAVDAKLFLLRQDKDLHSVNTLSDHDPLFAKIDLSLSQETSPEHIKKKLTKIEKRLIKRPHVSIIDNGGTLGEVAEDVSDTESVTSLDVDEILDELIEDPRALDNHPDRISILTKLVSEGAKNAHSVDGRELVLVIGRSGAGKSTFLNHLLDKPLRSYYDAGGELKIDVDGPSEFPIGQEGSKTFWPTFVPYTRGSDCSVVYCDCPGFGDTRGDIVSIANAVNIKAALHRASGVKVILLVPHLSILESRSQSFTETLDACANFFGGATELLRYRTSFLVGVTRLQMNDDGTFTKQASLDRIKHKLDEKHFKNNILVQAMSRGDISIFLHDPLEQGDRSEGFLSRQQCLFCINKLSAVDTPSFVFKVSLSPSDKQMISAIALEKKEAVGTYLHRKSYGKAAESIHDLERLSIVEHPTVSDLLEESKSRLEDVLSASVLRFRDACIQGRFSEASALLPEFAQMEHHFPVVSRRLHLAQMPFEYVWKEQEAKEKRALQDAVNKSTEQISQLLSQLEKERKENKERNAVMQETLRQQRLQDQAYHREQMDKLRVSLTETAKALSLAQEDLAANKILNAEDRSRLQQREAEILSRQAREREELEAIKEQQKASKALYEDFVRKQAERQKQQEAALAERDEQLQTLLREKSTQSSLSAAVISASIESPQITSQQARLPVEAFGKDAWLEYFGVDVGEDPPLTAAAMDIWDSKAPYLLEDEHQQNLVKENHLLTLIPSHIKLPNGRTVSFTLDCLGSLLLANHQRRFDAFKGNTNTKLGYHSHGYYFYGSFITDSSRRGSILGAPYWLLLPKTVLADSRSKNRSGHEKLISKYNQEGYRMPYALEVATSLLAHYARSDSKERLYFVNRHLLRTYTRCFDADKDGNSLFVGGFEPAGVNVRNSRYGVYGGLSCCLKL